MMRGLKILSEYFINSVLKIFPNVHKYLKQKTYLNCELFPNYDLGLLWTKQDMNPDLKQDYQSLQKTGAI
jgi:hypothetical protein